MLWRRNDCFKFWCLGRRENDQGSKETHLSVELWAARRYPDSQVFVNIEILKAPVSESIPVRAAWPLPLFGSHSIGSFKNFCQWTEITAPTSDKHQLPFIMNTHQALSNLTQTTAVLELAWTPLVDMPTQNATKHRTWRMAAGCPREMKIVTSASLTSSAPRLRFLHKRKSRSHQICPPWLDGLFKNKAKCTIARTDKC